MKIVQKLLLGLGLGLAFGVAMLSGCGSSTPGEVASEFITHAYNGNGDALIKYVSVPKQEGMEEIIDGKFKAQSAQAKAMAEKKGGPKAVEVVSEEVNGNKARVELKVIFGDDSTKTEYFKFNKIDDEWKIDL